MKGKKRAKAVVTVEYSVAPLWDEEHSATLRL